MLHNWQLIAAVLWLTIAVLIFFRDFLLSQEALDRLFGRNGNMGFWVGLFLFVFNIARWYQARSVRLQRERSVRLPLQPNPNAAVGYEYNPELDFHKPDDTPKA